MEGGADGRTRVGGTDEEGGTEGEEEDEEVEDEDEDDDEDEDTIEDVDVGEVRDKGMGEDEDEDEAGPHPALTLTRPSSGPHPALIRPSVYLALTRPSPLPSSGPHPALIRPSPGPYLCLRPALIWPSVTPLLRDVLLIQEAISDKAGVLIQYSTTFVAGFAIGFTSGWRMALVILSVVPVLAVCGAFMGTIMSRLATKGQAAYANAGAVAEEVLSAMRTVAAFGSEPNEVERYAVELEKARVENTRKGLVTGLGIGTTLLVTFCSYALAFWYGSTLVESGIMTAGDVVSTFFGPRGGTSGGEEGRG